jgi:hypothetical protein
MAEPFRLEVVPETEPAEGGQAGHADQVGFEMLRLGLKALSQRALIAFASVFPLLTVGSAFWLWYLTPKPDIYQIVSLTIYALFVLTANYLVRRA